MTKQTAEQLEKWFRNLARARIRAKGKKDQRYINDAGYWDGGRCDWGGSHSLAEDCHTLEKILTKSESTRDLKKQLSECVSKTEFDAKKANLIRKIEELISSMEVRIGSSSTYFGLCIIWADYTDDLNKEKEAAKKELQRTKEGLAKTNYEWSQELKELDSEIKKINDRMKENERKAMNETDPAKKARIIESIEEDGKLLLKTYEKKKELSNKLNFDPAKKVQDLIAKMKRAIERNIKKGNSNSSDDSQDDDSDSNDKNSDSDNDSDDEKDPNDDPNYRKKRKKQEKNQSSNFFQNNQQLIIILGLAAFVIFYLMNQKQEKEPNYYDF